jgi:acetyltransferase-like isoleucine patch superfamily enzyme
MLAGEPYLADDAPVTIGRDSVVGAGSVVISDLPAGHLCVGNPCRRVREL